VQADLERKAGTCANALEKRGYKENVDLALDKA